MTELSNNVMQVTQATFEVYGFTLRESDSTNYNFVFLHNSGQILK